MSHEKSSQQSSAGERLVAFDFVRIVAAILVVLDHFAFSSHSVNRTELHSSLMAPVIKYAFVTVDVFFIISGYVIMMTAIGRNWRAFAVARVSRLLPPLAVCATITFIGCLILAPYSYRSIGVVDWLGNVTGLILIPGLGQKFQIADVVYWTIQIEAAFYVLVAIGLAIGTTHNRLLTVMLGICLASTIASSYVTGVNVVLFAGQFVSRFVVGGALFSLSRAPRSPAAWGIFGGGLMLLLYSIWQRSIERINLEHVVFNPWISCAAMMAGVAILMFFVFRPIRRRFSWAAFAGGVTYPLYLVHHQLGCAISRAMGLGDTVAGVFGLTAAMVIFAIFIHWGTEAPLVSRLRRALSTAFLPKRSAPSARVL